MNNIKIGSVHQNLQTQIIKSTKRNKKLRNKLNKETISTVKVPQPKREIEKGQDSIENTQEKDDKIENKKDVLPIPQILIEDPALRKYNYKNKIYLGKQWGG